MRGEEQIIRSEQTAIRRDDLVRPGERLDDLGRKGYHIIQNPRAFCFGMDAVLLAAFAEVRKTDRVLDLGTGTGILPILLEARYDVSRIVGLEIQEDMVEMASRSVAWNDLEGIIQMVHGDIRDASARFGRASFDAIVSNPPYMKSNHGLCNPEDSRAVSRHEILCELEDVVRETSLLLKPGGHFYMVHRPQRTAEILCCLRDHRLEPKRIRMVHPFADSEANMILVDSVRGGNPWVKVEPPLIIFREKDRYTDEVRKIYGIDD